MQSNTRLGKKVFLPDDASEKYGNRLVSYVLPNSRRTIDVDEFVKPMFVDVKDVSGQVVCLKDRPKIVGVGTFQEDGILLIPERQGIPINNRVDFLPNELYTQPAFGFSAARSRRCLTSDGSSR